MSLPREEYEKRKQQQERYKREMQKNVDANTEFKNGKKVIKNIQVANKAQSGKQTHGRSNKAGTGLNSQEGKKKTKEDRKKENSTEQDKINEKAQWLSEFQDKNSIGLVKTFDNKKDSKNSIKEKKKISKKEQIIINNNKRILQKEIDEELRIISKIENCSTYEEIEYFYRSIRHSQILYLFTTLKWIYNKYNELLKKNDSFKKTELIQKFSLKMKIIILHIEDREVKDIDSELMSIYENCKELTSEMCNIELQLTDKILPKPMNDFKDELIKADMWQSNVINLINENYNILVCAPTSTGKTIIGTYMASKKGRTLFIVPNESVAIQVMGVIMNFATDGYTIQTKNIIIENDNAKMIVGTPIEVELYLLKLGIYDMDRIIIDEIHCLNNNDTHENIEYANSIKRLMLLLSGQFLFLSATLTDESMNNLKSYIEMIKNKECKVVKHTERFINLQFRIMNNKKDIESINPFSQIDLDEIDEFKGKNMSITNKDIWNFWEACLDEDEFIPQMEKWLGNGLLSLNTIQKLSNKIPKFIENQIEEDLEYIQDILEEVGSNVERLEIDMENEEQLNDTLFKLIMNLKKDDLLPAILFQNEIENCYEIHQRIIEILEKEQDEKYPTFYQDKKAEAKKYDAIQSKIEKMQESSTKIKCSSKQDRDSAYKSQEQQRETQKEQISNMKETQFGIDLNIHAPHPDYSCGISQISDDSMRQIRWTMKLKTSGYETTFMKGIQRGIGIYTQDMPSINQHVMRKLIQNKNIGLLIADNSLAYGVNLPIRTVIILYNGTISSQTILQQIGRAGRRGLDTQGNIIIINVKNNTGKNPVKEILMAKFPTIYPELTNEYFSYTELIKPFCMFETKKKSDKYLEILNNILDGKDNLLIENSIEKKFVDMIQYVFKNDSVKIIDYLKKVIWLINSHQVNNPKNARLLCYIPYNNNKNISSIILYLLMPFLTKKFGNINGISHIESRYLFKIMISLYDKDDESKKDILDEEISNVLNESGFTDIFGNVTHFEYSNDIYEHYVHNSVPDDQKSVIKIKFRFETIKNILNNVHNTLDGTEFKELKPLILNVSNKVERLIEKCQSL